MSRLAFVLLLLVQAARPAPPPQTPGNASPGQPANASPVQPAVAADPATAAFSTDAGLLLMAVKTDKVADYEEAVRALQEAMSKAADDRYRAMAQGWRVYKAAELDTRGNTLYVHVLLPAVPKQDYRLSLLLDELLAGASPELLAKYRDALAAPPSKLGLTEFAHMAVAPAPKPANASPPGPVVKKPGG